VRRWRQAAHRRSGAAFGCPHPGETKPFDTSVMTRTRCSSKLALALLLACASPIAAQVQVNRVDDLRFGNVLAGVPKTMLRTDPAGAGRYDIITPPNAFLIIRFTLPSVMTGPGGATMPLSFSGTTAGYSDAQVITSQIGFSPTAGTFRRSTDGRASVFLGGTVTPAAAQVAGSYTGIITLSLTVF
jgi:hypothetical protein